MEDKELIQAMYGFAIELAMDLEKDKFNIHRDKWNKLMAECETKLNML